MPQMDGRKTSAALRKINPDLKIIFTSGFDDQPITEENLAGVVGFLKKPYSINQVSKSLKEMLAQEENWFRTIHEITNSNREAKQSIFPKLEYKIYKIFLF